MKKWLGWLILLMMLVSFTAVADITLPRDTSVIEEEAFMGDTSLTSLVLPSGTLQIDDRAFKDCTGLTEIYIPSSVNSIGENAFENDEKLVIRCYLPSYAHQYAAAQGIPYTVLGNYWITEAVKDNTSIKATVTTESACFLSVEILSQDKSEVLTSKKVQIDEAFTDKEISVDFEELPEYFALRAVICDEFGAAISDPLESIRYTQAYVEFARKMPEDFESRSVLDFGVNGFGVLKDELKQVTGIIQDNHVIVSPGTPIEAGDALFLSNENVYLKAKTVSVNEDGSYTVTEDPDATLLDFYKYLRVDNSEGYTSRSPFSIARSAGRRDAEPFFEVDTEGGVTTTATGSICPVLVTNLDTAVFGPDYLNVELFIELFGEVKYEISGEATLNKDFGIVDHTFPIGAGWGINVQVKVPVELKAAASAGFTTTFSGRLGFKYDNETKSFSKIQTSDLKATIHANGEVGAKVGPELDVGLSWLGLTGSIGAWIGGDLTAETSREVNLLREAEEKHACDLCFDVELNKFVELNAELSWKHLFGDRESLGKKSWPLSPYPVFDGYLSMINSPDSVHHGHIVLDKGECPNKEYLVKIRTLDAEGEERTGETVTIRNANGTAVAEKTSPLSVYLPAGEYTASSTYLDGTATEEFEIKDGSVSVDLVMKEKDVLVYGYVYDDTDNTPLSGASVKCGAESATTDSEGRFELEMASGDYYTFVFSHDGYETYTAQSVYIESYDGSFGFGSIYLCPFIQVTGVVMDSETDEVLSGVAVRCGDAYTTTGSDGTFSFAYDYTASTASFRLDGYNEATCSLTYYSEGETLTVYMTKGNERMLCGTIRDAGSLQPISGVAVSVGESSTVSDSSGYYELMIPMDEATVSYAHSDYIGIVRSIAEDDSVMDIEMTKILSGDEYRAILTWGATPYDLDSHLFGPDYHVYYASSYGTNAYLDRDDTDSYGPETITFTISPDETYEYYLHDYTNRDYPESTDMAGSGAVITLYKGDTVLARRSVPSGAGTAWHVFTLKNGELTFYNTIYHEHLESRSGRSIRLYSGEEKTPVKNYRFSDR